MGSQKITRAYVSIVELALLVLRDILGFRIPKRPNLIDLNAPACQIAQNLIWVAGACRAHVHQQLDHSVFAGADHGADRTNAVAFLKAGKGLGTALYGKAIHARLYD